MRTLAVFTAALVAGVSLNAAEVKYIDDSAFLKSLTATFTKLKDDGKLKVGKDMLAACNSKKAKLDITIQPGPKIDQSMMYDTLKKKVLVHCSGNMCGKCSKFHIGCSTTYAITKDVIVFNYHAIKDKEVAYHAVSDCDGRMYPVTEFLAYDKDNDICIARVEGASFDPFAVTPDEPVGNKVVVMSNPDNMYYVMTQGDISRYYTSVCEGGGKKRNGGRGNWMSITADYAKGSSGAPILNMNGSVVGMVASTQSIYYNEEKGKHDNLQMVVKCCVPASFILKLIEKPEKK